MDNTGYGFFLVNWFLTYGVSVCLRPVVLRLRKRRGQRNWVIIRSMLVDLFLSHQLTNSRNSLSGGIRVCLSQNAEQYEDITLQNNNNNPGTDIGSEYWGMCASKNKTFWLNQVICEFDANDCVSVHIITCLLLKPALFHYVKYLLESFKVAHGICHT